jgi:hypothetical protein
MMYGECVGIAPSILKIGSRWPASHYDLSYPWNIAIKKVKVGEKYLSETTKTGVKNR